MKIKNILSLFLILISLTFYSQEEEFIEQIELVENKSLKQLFKANFIPENSISSCSLLFGDLQSEIVGLKLHSSNFEGSYYLFFKKKLYHNCRKEKYNNKTKYSLLHSKLKRRKIKEIEKRYLSSSFK